MRPTFSIICFTVLSGAGYGLLFLTGLSLMLGWPLDSPTAVFFDGAGSGATEIDGASAHVTFAIVLAAGVLLATAGLLSSVVHLAKPLRAWRAFSQWRSSWLSREGVASLLTYVPALGAFAFAIRGEHAPRLVAAADGLALAVLSAATVVCTGRIYASLKPIRAWHNRYVVPGYLLLAFYSGAMWMTALYALPASGSAIPVAVAVLYVCNAILAAPACAALKWRYWRSLDANPKSENAGSATGLERIGRVRSFEAPHTEENYLTHEMGFVLARKHARRLRILAFWLILLAPASMIPLAFLVGVAAAWAALIAGMLGVFVERWLFFAEARHAVIAYYGR